MVMRHMSDSLVKVIIPLLVSALFAPTSGAKSALAIVWRRIITWQRTARSFFSYALCRFRSRTAAMA